MIFGDPISFANISGIAAFGTGILSFFSPCILPLIPSYLIFISGITFEDYSRTEFTKYRKIVLIHSIAFIFGFSFVFVSLGLSSSLIGRFFSAYQIYIARFGGLLLIVMGLYYLNLINIPILNKEKIIHLKEKPLGIAGSFVVGITFSLGWTPCVGPALSSILIIASTTKNVWEGVYLLSLYSLGLAIPFIFSALLFDRLFGLIKRFHRVVVYSMKILGILLVLTGLLLFTSFFGTISSMAGSLFR